MAERYVATIDRIEGGETAVMHLESDGETVDELGVHVDELPEDGRHEGAVFDVVIAGESLIEADYRPGETTERRRDAQKRFDRLSDRLGDE